MKTTGVVRRIDDLGRIVIPKEIRRSLRIRDGEPLEIFVDKEVITLKKYSSIEDLSEIAKNFVETISKSLGKIIFIADRDKFIAISKEQRKKYLNQPISKYLAEIMDYREVVMNKEIEDLEITENEIEEMSYVIVPIILNGDPIGLIVIASLDESVLDLDGKIAMIMSSFLAKYIEE